MHDMEPFSDDDLFEHEQETRRPSLNENRTSIRQASGTINPFDGSFNDDINNPYNSPFGDPYRRRVSGMSNTMSPPSMPFNMNMGMGQMPPMPMGMGQMQPMDNSMMNPFMSPPQPALMPLLPPDMYLNYHHSNSSSNYTQSTMVGEDYKARHKTVAFQDIEPEVPGSTYKYQHQNPSSYDLDDIEDMNINYEYNDNLDDEFSDMMPTRQATFNGDNYMINPLEDVEAEGGDPFDDEESLFSVTSSRQNSIRRNKPENHSIKEEKHNYDFDEDDEDDEDFRPKLNYTKTIKRAKLLNGNYVIDCSVPKPLLDTYGKKVTDSGKEMSFLRYSACTCGPSNFTKFNYNLRQAMYTPKRETEIMCVVTMYNEDEVLLAKTLKGIFNNIKNLTNRNHTVWGDDSWKKVVVVIVSDGRAALNKRAEQLLTAIGIYQDLYAKSKVNNKTVKSHIFEYTSTVGIETINEDKIHLTANDIPVQFLFCLKEQNTRKINSHRWCFQSFAPILNPRVVMLLDCGTVPAKDSFYHLWKSFNDPNVAGACGEMKSALGPNRSLLMNPLVAAQNFEYKISNVLDKPMESTFGFISVLPGAFSAYRYEALLNVNGKGPLEKYFKGEFLHHSAKINDEEDDERELKEKNFREVGIFTTNMYLAEDRILCFELVSKKGKNYILRYVNEAIAETDVPETIEDFVLQRRRWLNGSLFAACYSIFHWTNIWKSNHSLLRKFVLQIEFYYQLVVILVSWFSMGSFFLVFNILTTNLGSKTIDFEIGKYLSVVCNWVYVATVIITFVLAFGNTPRGTKKFYMVIAVIFAILMVYMLFAAIYLAVSTIESVLGSVDFTPTMLISNYKFRDLVISMGSTYALYFLASLMYGEPSFMITSFFQYLLLSPTYVNVLNIYSFCNINDISWGTRSDPKAKDFGQAKSTGSNKEDIVMVVNGHEESEINETYLNTLEQLRVVPDKLETVNQRKDKDDNYYALIRTITVLGWVFSNLILIAVVLEIGGVNYVLHSNQYTNISPNAQVFLTIILWIVAGLAVYRFFGSLLYLIFKAFRPLKWKLKHRA